MLSLKCTVVNLLLDAKILALIEDLFTLEWNIEKAG